MNWSSNEAIDHCLLVLKWDVAFPPEFKGSQDVTEKTKAVIFKIPRSSLELAIPPRKSRMTCYVPFTSAAGSPFPNKDENDSILNADISVREEYPRKDGKKISSAVLLHAPSLQPSKKPRLVGIGNKQAFLNLLKWLLDENSNVASIIEPDEQHLKSAIHSEPDSQKSIFNKASKAMDSESGYSGDSDSVKNTISDLKNAMCLAAEKIEDEYRNKPGEDVDVVVKRRVGQSQFRALLGSIYGVACHISGLPKERLLIASHIVPWSKATGEEKTDPDNGLLLAVNWDAVFDKGFICFDEKGHVIFSEELDEESVRLLGIDANVRLREDLLTPNRLSYLQRHREEIFERWKKTVSSKKDLS